MRSVSPQQAAVASSPGPVPVDRVKKLAYYRRIGVPESWVVDPDERALMRFLLGDHPR